MELSIDTSTDTASIAISSQGEVIAELTWHAGQNHTVELVPHLNHLLSQAKSELKDIKVVFVAKGPGSFNGLRVGMSFSKGLALSLGIPVIGISTLESEAFPYAFTGLPICPIQNAGRGEIATALFHFRREKWRRLREEHITTLENLLLEIKVRTIICARVPEQVVSQLKGNLGRKALIVENPNALRRAGNLAALGWQRLKHNDFEHPPTLEPLYLRRPAITTNNRNATPRMYVM